jgi:hypothetical protein
MAETIPAQAELIRAWLELQSGPRTCVDIAAAIGKPRDQQAYRNVHRMFRDGMLSRTGQCRSYAFAIAREPAPKLPRDERKRRKADRERASRRRMGLPGQTRAEYRAQCRARAEATRARLEAAKAQRKAARDAERAKRQAARDAARTAKAATRKKKAKAPPKPRAPRVRVLKPAAPAPQQPREVESVADFLRRGGKITRLEPHAVSHPLRITEELRAA